MAGGIGTNRGRGRALAARTAAVLVALAAVLLLVAAPAGAHADLESTDPPAGGQVDTAPSAITLNFTEGVTVRDDGVRLLDGDGADLDVGPPTHPGGDDAVVRVTVPDLDRGLYAVVWRAVSADAHPVQGTFTFGVGTSGSGKAADALAATANEGIKGDRAVGLLFGVARFGVFVGLALLLGSVWFAASLWPGGRSRRAVHRLIGWAFGITAVATVAGFLLQGPYTTGGDVTDVFSWDLITETWDSRFGKVWVLRLALLVVAGILVRIMLRSRDALPDWWYDAAGVTAIALAATPGLAGHASTGRWVVVAIPADALHVLGMAVWMGGLAMLVLARREPDFGRIALRFSGLALVAVTVIVLTGVFQAVRQVPDLADLLDTDYGRLLFVKVMVFVVLVVLAALSRRLLHGPGMGLRGSPPAPVAVGGPGLGADDGAPGAVATLAPPEAEPVDEVAVVPPPEPGLVRAVLVELALGALILGLTAGLVETAPPRQTVATGPVQTVLGTGPVRIDTAFTPAESGTPNELHLTAVGRNGLATEVVDMQASISSPSRDVPPIDVDLQKLGVGHYFGQSVVVPFPGQWVLSVTTFTTDVDSFTVTTPVGVS